MARFALGDLSRASFTGGFLTLRSTVQRGSAAGGTAAQTHFLWESAPFSGCPEGAHPAGRRSVHRSRPARLPPPCQGCSTRQRPPLSPQGRGNPPAGLPFPRNVFPLLSHHHGEPPWPTSGLEVCVCGVSSRLACTPRSKTGLQATAAAPPTFVFVMSLLCPLPFPSLPKLAAGRGALPALPAPLPLTRGWMPARGPRR